MFFKKNQKLSNIFINDEKSAMILLKCPKTARTESPAGPKTSSNVMFAANTLQNKELGDPNYWR